MRVLLVSPMRDSAQICGDDIVTHMLLSHPPDGVKYTHHQAGLREGAVRRDAAARAWLAALFMHARPPAGHAHDPTARPTWPMRFKARLFYDRPDEDVQWLALPRPADFDLVHAFSYSLHLNRAAQRLPVVLATGCGNMDLLLNYYDLPADISRALARRDGRLLRALGVMHESYATRNACRVIVPSAYSHRLHVEGGVPEDKLRIVRLGFPTPNIPDRPREANEFRFTLVGHQFKRKGGRAVLAAFERLHRLHPEARLTLISAVNLAEWGVDPAGITVIPTLPHDAIYQTIYPTADVVLLPSLAEGYGMSVVEAMGFGVPAIASTTGALPELVLAGDNGLLVTPDDDAGLFEAMRLLMEDAALRKRMGHAARAHFLAEHSCDVTNPALVKVYKEALKSS